MRETGRVNTDHLDWTGWQLVEKRPGYEHWIKIEGEKIHNRELYDDAYAVREAQIIRDTHQKRPADTQEAMRHQFVMPESMRAQAIVEGWHDDLEYIKKKFVRNNEYRDLKTTDEQV